MSWAILDDPPGVPASAAGGKKMLRYREAWMDQRKNEGEKTEKWMNEKNILRLKLIELANIRWLVGKKEKW